MTEQYDRHARSESMDLPRRHEDATAEHVGVGVEQRAERPLHIARCAFELIGVTVRSQKPGEALAVQAAEASEQDRMTSSLVSVLAPGQSVTFAYEGGGRRPLRWQIIGEAASSESASQASESMRNVQHALMTVLESRRTSYRFEALSEAETRRIGKVQHKWVGLIQPHGTHVKHTKGRVGFGILTDLPQEEDAAVYLPHYTQDRAKAFSSIVKLLVSSRDSLRITIKLEACRLSLEQEHAIKAARDVVLGRGPDSDLPAHLENTASSWLKTLAGCRITCAVWSSRPVSTPFLRMLGGEIYNGAVDVSCSRLLPNQCNQRNPPALPSVLGREPASPARLRGAGWRAGLWISSSLKGNTAPKGVLDLRNCIPSMATLPCFFPQPEVLARHGMRRFYNRERLTLPGAGLLMGRIKEGRTEQKVRLCQEERSRHCYCLGATGTGKSTLLLNLIMQDIEHGHGVCLVDPHGDLYKKVCESLPASRADDVVILDPCDRERAVGLNLLDCDGPCREMQVNFVINELLAIVSKLYDLRACGGPVFEQYFRAALQLIMSDPANAGTLVDMSAVFEHKDFRDAMIKKCEPSLLADFWKMAKNTCGETSLANMGPYIVSKLNMFVHNAMLRPIIGQAKSTIDFRQIMDRRGILLVNLSRGALGEMDMRLFGMVVLTKLICAAMGRLDMAASRRKPFHVYVDEFQNFTTDATASLLSESRKFGLCLTLANQNLSQLSAGDGSENLVDSVLGNVGSMVLFRLGAPDAAKLSVYTNPAFGPEDLQALPNFNAAARLLTPTGPTDAFVFETYPANKSRANPAILQRIKQNNQRYSTKIATVEREIRERREAIRNVGKTDDSKKPPHAEAMAKTEAKNNEEMHKLMSKVLGQSGTEEKTAKSTSTTSEPPRKAGRKR